MAPALADREIACNQQIPRHARHINKLESRLAKHARIKLVQTVANAWLNKCRILIVASRATHSNAKRARRCIRNAKGRPAQPSVNAPNRKCRPSNATPRQIQNVANYTTRRVKLVRTSLAQSIRLACENSSASSSRHATVPLVPVKLLTGTFQFNLGLRKGLSSEDRPL